MVLRPLRLCALAVSLVVITPTAPTLAIVLENQPAGFAPPLQEVQPQRIELPVIWQVTRARMIASGPTTLTESFRETWVLERRLSGIHYLQSPRARVAISIHETQAKPLVHMAADPHPPLSNNASLPARLALTEHAFARLVGIDRPSDVATGHASPQNGRIITLDLRRIAKQGDDIVIAANEDEHYDVHFAIGSHVFF